MDIVCPFCQCLFRAVTDFKEHVRIHKFCKSFPCRLQGCNFDFKKYSTFANHLNRSHLIQSDDNTWSFECTVKSCDYKHKSFSVITKHLKDHLTQGTSVYCPLRCRDKPFETKNSLTIHNMYYHKDKRHTQQDSMSNNNPEHIETEQNNLYVISEEEKEEEQESQHVKNATKSAGLLFLNLLSKHHVPNTAVQQIVEHLANLSSFQDSISQGRIATLAKNFNLSDYEKSEIFDNLGTDNLNHVLFNAKEGIFRSEHMRKKYFRDNFNYVEPKQIDLGLNKDHKESFYYYVPVIATLKSILSGSNAFESFFSTSKNNEDYMVDYTDGHHFKNHSFLNQPYVVHIFLYQDAFGTVNPLGDAKTRHKIVGVYYTLGNFHPSLRSTTENTFLALLCLEKDLAEYGVDKMFAVLVQDLTQLETEGIHVHVSNMSINVRGTIFALLGDNLGTHQMAGLSENFSSHQFFSRYCYTTLDNFRATPLKRCELRKQISYEEDLEQVQLSGYPYRGIKRSSIFNDLQQYKLFDFGMPPCISHDLFLGCFNYDIMLIFHRLVKLKLVGEKYIESRTNFLFKKLQLNSKITLNMKKQCITSKATDVWHLIQISPFIFMKKEKAQADDGFKLLIMLKNITDIVTAPIVSEYQVGVLRLNINQYIQKRSQLFTMPLRPKHHYLYHYPHLILNYGPLINFSTMTGERKHSYFKTALRHASNYKNVLKLCSERHQYWQALIHSNQYRFTKRLLLGKEKFIDELDETTQSQLRQMGLDANTHKFSESVDYLGTTFAIDNCLFLHADEFGDQYSMLRLKGIVVSTTSTKMYFLGRRITVTPIAELGLHTLDNSQTSATVECIDAEQITDTTPAKMYVCEKNVYIFHKHAFPCC